jgi:peptidoglycan-N-acetylglucosamine deacetylase
VLVVALLAPVAIPLRLVDRPPPIGVTVRDEVRYVRPTLSFGEAVTRYRLRAEPGDLLDVDGLILDPDVYRGVVLLNGARGVAWDGLADGDVIEIVDGDDRTEPTEQVVTVIPGGQPGNPQFFLGNQPGEQVTTQGRISGKVVSVEFRPTGPREEPPAVALTFDDGPHPTYTPEVLSILRRHHVPATFFVIGYLAARYPELVRREARNGVVASHTWSHPQALPFRDLRRRELRREVVRGVHGLEDLGVSPRLFRPPGGSYDEQVVAMVDRHGMRVVLWGVDPEDWREDLRPRQIARRVLRNVRPGSIVLLHDGGGDQSATVRALPRIIRGIRRMGLRFSAIGPSG